jgi:hypothetical protein
MYAGCDCSYAEHSAADAGILVNSIPKNMARYTKKFLFILILKNYT